LGVCAADVIVGVVSCHFAGAIPNGMAIAAAMLQLSVSRVYGNNPFTTAPTDLKVDLSMGPGFNNNPILEPEDAGVKFSSKGVTGEGVGIAKPIPNVPSTIVVNLNAGVVAVLNSKLMSEAQFRLTCVRKDTGIPFTDLDDR
jgi:hypothetical protein